MKPPTQVDIVRSFHDEDSQYYADQRYPREPQTCNEWAYIVRKGHVLRLLSRVPVGPGPILDLGCGPGIYTRELVDVGWTVCSLDLSRQMLLRARSTLDGSAGTHRAAFASANAEHLPFSTAAFDCVLGIGVISYVENLDAALAEISRVLKPGGTAILQISNRSSLYEMGVRLKNRIMIPLSRGRHKTNRARLFDEIRLRAYRPHEFRARCSRQNLEPTESCSYNYAIPILIQLMPRVALAVGRFLEARSRSRHLPWLGAGYLVALRKPDDTR